MSAKLYHDQIAGGTTVHLQLTPNALRILAEDGKEIASWDYTTLELTQDLLSPTPACFRHESSHQNLYISKLDDYQQIRAYMKSNSHGSLQLQKQTRIVITALLFVLMIAVGYFSIPYFVEHTLPWSVQETIGRHVRHDIVDKHRIIYHDRGEAILKKIYQPLVEAADLSIPLTFEVIDNPEPNAVALPGGIILIHSGLIEHVKDPRAISGVLAHEIGHVKYNHGMKNIAKSFGVNILSTLLIGSDSPLANGEFLLHMKFSRDSEREADMMAIDLLKQTHTSSQPLAEFFQSIDHDSSWLEFASSHPATPDRIKLFQQHDNQESNPVLTPTEWQQLQKIYHLETS